MLLTELWVSKSSILNIDGFEYVNCPLSKYDRKARRNSGGITLYFKQKFRDYLSIASIDFKGLLWLKLKKDLLRSDKDAYFGICYVPPEDSGLYHNVNSDLFQFDFFEHLSNEIRKYEDLGHVFLMGDLTHARASNLTQSRILTLTVFLISRASILITAAYLYGKIMILPLTITDINCCLSVKRTVAVF